MKFLRKLVLAICAVGLVGLAGYTVNAMAAVSLEVTVDSNNDVVVSFPEEVVIDEEGYENQTNFAIADGATIKIKIGGSEIHRYNYDDGMFDVDEPFNLTDLIFGKI